MTINAIDKSVQLLNCFDGSLRSRYPLGELPGLALNFIASGWNQSISNSGTITGPAPLGVFFNATGTISGGKDSFTEVGYHWHFGDTATASAGVFRFGTNVDRINYKGGPVVGRVFKKPGTYVVSCRADDGTYTADRSVTIIVQNPNTVYSGSSTILYSTDGSDDQVTYPGAIPRTWSVTATAVANTRYLFKRGQTFGSSLIIPVINNTGSVTATPVTNVVISDWGSATDSPVFSGATGINIATDLSNAAGNTFPGFPYNISVSNIKGQVQVTYFASYLVITDCDMSGKPMTNFGSTGDDLFGSLDGGSGLTNQVWTNPRDLHFTDNTISATANSAAQTFFVYGMNMNIAGNHIGEGKEHGLRHKAGKYVSIRNNYVTGENDPAFTGKHNITIRSQQISAAAPDTSTTASTNSTGTWYPTRIMNSSNPEYNGNLATKYVIVDDNILGKTDWTGDNWYAGGPEFFNALVIFKMEDVIYQRNKIYPGTNAIANNRTPLHSWGGVRTTFRNNDFYSLSSSIRVNPRLAILTSNAGGDNPGQTTATYNPVYINTSTDGSAGNLGTFVFEAPTLITPRKAGT